MDRHRGRFPASLASSWRTIEPEPFSDWWNLAETPKRSISLLYAIPNGKSLRTLFGVASRRLVVSTRDLQNQENDADSQDKASAHQG